MLLRAAVALVAALAVLAPASASTPQARILFTQANGSSPEIAAIDADGSDQRRLTHDGPEGFASTSQESFDSAPAWGRRAATRSPI
jgi:hypothetical protein